VADALRAYLDAHEDDTGKQSSGKET